MVASNFSEWLNNNLLPIVREHLPNVPGSIGIHTALRWLHKPGFDSCSTRKGAYIDQGHRKWYGLNSMAVLVFHCSSII